jgi:hypothetical protein
MKGTNVGLRSGASIGFDAAGPIEAYPALP